MSKRQPHTIRFPQDIYDAMKRLANQRDQSTAGSWSFNAEVVDACKKHVAMAEYRAKEDEFSMSLNEPRQATNAEPVPEDSTVTVEHTQGQDAEVTVDGKDEPPPIDPELTYEKMLDVDPAEAEREFARANGLDPNDLTLEEHQTAYRIALKQAQERVESLRKQATVDVQIQNPEEMDEDEGAGRLPFGPDIRGRTEVSEDDDSIAGMARRRMGR